jgi:hypothetical protein
MSSASVQPTAQTSAQVARYSFAAEKGAGSKEGVYSRYIDSRKSNNNVNELTNSAAIFGGTAEQFRGSVVARADVANACSARCQRFHAPKVAYLDQTSFFVEEDVTGFQVTMTGVVVMQKCHAAENLNRDQLQSNGDMHK